MIYVDRHHPRRVLLMCTYRQATWVHLLVLATISTFKVTTNLNPSLQGSRWNLKPSVVEGLNERLRVKQRLRPVCNASNCRQDRHSLMEQDDNCSFASRQKLLELALVCCIRYFLSRLRKFGVSPHRAWGPAGSMIAFRGLPRNEPITNNGI